MDKRTKKEMLSAIAKKYGVTAGEVERDMATALTQAQSNPSSES